ncbi:MAG: class I SAM-dependent methyltransferase [Promethearchaeota archaeon]
MPRFKDTLKEYLKDTIPADKLDLLPRGFQTLEDVLITNLKPELLKYKTMIGRAYMELLPYIKSVWCKTFGVSKVVGQFRTPTGVEHVAGEKKSIVQVVENGVIFKHDFTKIIFSKGNIKERSYLPSKVKDGEVIVDMFAGIGYFSLMIAKKAKPKRIYACEINPVSFSFLSENIRLNEVSSTIDARQGDCAEIVPRLKEEYNLVADRIIMGVFPAPKQYLPVAFQVLNKKRGTMIHYEGKVSEKNVEPLLKHVQDAVENSPIASTFELIEHRFVKNVGVRQQHAVLDVLVK